MLVAAIERYLHLGDSLISHGNEIMVAYLWVGLGSIIFGFMNSWLLLRGIKKIRGKLDNPTIIVSLMLFHILAIYGLCHLPFLQLSGDVAIIIYAFNLRNYGMHTMLPKTAGRVSVVVLFLKERAEQYAFVSMGIFSVCYFTHNFTHSRIFVISFCILLAWFILTAITGCIQHWRHKKYTLGEEMFLCSGKMIKGDLAFVLFGMMMNEHWNAKLSILVYSIITWTY